MMGWYKGHRYLQTLLCFSIYLLVTSKSETLSMSPTSEPTMVPTQQPLDTANILIDEQSDIIQDTDFGNNNGPISSEIDKLLSSFLPWTIEIDYIFITIIGLLICYLFCCCLSQFYWYNKTQDLRREVERAKDKTEIKIVRPGTPILNDLPSLSHLTERRSLGINDDYDDDDASSRFFSMFQPRTQVKEGGDDVVEYSHSEKARIVHIN